MSDKALSDELLNAFLDGQLDEAERSRVFEMLDQDPALNAQVCELRKLKDLVRHAYAHPPAARRPQRRPGRPLLSSVAAALLLALGAVGGWLAHGWNDGHPQTLAQQDGAKAVRGVVIQVSDGDPAKWAMALNSAQNIRQGLGSRHARIEIVAYGPGLDMLKKGSLLGPRLERAVQDGIKLYACGNTMRATHTRRQDLLPFTDIVKAGVIEIMRRQQEGYSYIRP